MKKVKVYELVNMDGCLMFKSEFGSDKEAYNFAKENYSGKYRLLKHDDCEIKERNVNLK